MPRSFILLAGFRQHRKRPDTGTEVPDNPGYITLLADRSERDGDYCWT